LEIAMTYNDKIELGLFSSIVGICVPLTVVAGSLQVGS
jgi:hypothetical protein